VSPAFFEARCRLQYVHIKQLPVHSMRRSIVMRPDAHQGGRHRPRPCSPKVTVLRSVAPL